MLSNENTRRRARLGVGRSSVPGAARLRQRRSRQIVGPSEKEEKEGKRVKRKSFAND